jgi:hypothetical protein
VSNRGICYDLALAQYAACFGSDAAVREGVLDKLAAVNHEAMFRAKMCACICEQAKSRGVGPMGFSDLLTRELYGQSEAGRQMVELIEPLDFAIAINGGGVRITVPAGFPTDQASVPPIFWPIFPPAGKWSRASVIHDYLCTLSRLGKCSRFLADAIFREGMHRLGVPAWRRVAMYYGCRFWGVFWLPIERWWRSRRCGQ